MDTNSYSDEKSIIDFDDEYCENKINENKNNITDNENNDINKNDQMNNPKNNNSQEEEDQAIAAKEDEEVENVEEEKEIINDPKVKELNEIDINNKQAIIDILMQDNLITKKPIKKEDFMKDQNKNKYLYVNSSVKKKNTNGTKKNSFGRVGYQIEHEEGDPQFVKDINVAAYLLKDQIQEENKDVAKLLFDDVTPNLTSKKIITRKEIGEKVQKALENKRKNLERIEKEMYQEQKSMETFTPAINHKANEGDRRDLETFLKFQNDFQKKVENKKNSLMVKKEAEIKELNVGKPKINKYSEQLTKNNNNGEPVYLRLYNKRNIKEKKEEEEKKENNQKKEEEKKRKEKSQKKNNLYSHVKSKLNILRKSPSQAGGNAFKDEVLLSKTNAKNNSKVKIPFDRNAKSLNKRDKSESDIFRNRNKKLFDIKDLPTNKMLWSKFIKDFDEALINLNEDNNNMEENIEELDLYQYHKLLFILGMVTYPPEQKENEQKNENDKQMEVIPETNVESMLKVDENNLISDSFNLLKLDQDKVKTINIRNFLMFVLDNQNYDLYQQYKTNHEQDLKELFPVDKFKKEDIPELVLKKQNEELLSNVDKSNKKNNKYFYVSHDNKLIFTLDKSNNIKKDFSMFSLNYRNKRRKGKEEQIINIIKQKYPFKPTINVRSEKLYQKYKDKVYAIHSDTVTSNNSQYKKESMEYIDRILLLDKRRLAENQKIKEELLKKETKECTFKPKINQNYPSKKKEIKQDNQTKNENNENKGNNDTNNILKKNNSKNKSRFDLLYEHGKKFIQSKKDKSREEIELDRQKNECTFQPNIKNLNSQKIPLTKFNNDIYNEKEYKYLYERLKHGRLERMVKDSNNDRYGLNNELKQFVKDNKEFNYIQNQAYFEPENPYYYNNNQNEFENNFNSEKSIFQNENNTTYTSNTKNDGKEEDNNSEEGAPDKKDEIPLLIIDVNIRQGVKKKIFVYEGDTPEELADKFAKKHNLEPETKNKLQSLIQSHMMRLLTKIEEENQSSKSQNSQNQKIF